MLLHLSCSSCYRRKDYLLVNTHRRENAVPNIQFGSVGNYTGLPPICKVSTKCLLKRKGDQLRKRAINAPHVDLNWCNFSCVVGNVCMRFQGGNNYTARPLQIIKKFNWKRYLN